MAGVPFRYDPDLKAYRVPHGYKFPGLDRHQHEKRDPTDLNAILPVAKRLLKDTRRLSQSLEAFCDLVEGPPPTAEASTE